jgi:hypothetical protein
MSIKISNLPPAEAVNNGDLVPIVQNGITKKATAVLIRPTFGTAAGTACEGNDVRLIDPRTPKGPASGDLTAEYPGPALTTTGVVALTYGGAAQVGQFTVDAKGRITSAASVAITPAAIGALSISSLGPNVSAFLTTPSSANLAAALTDEVGSGSVVFASGVNGSGSAVLDTSPTIATPTINGYIEGNTNLGTVTTTATLNITSSTVLTATLTASTACTFTLPPVGAGKSFVLYLKQAPSTGNGTATFVTSPAGNISWPGGVAPTVTATAGRLDIFSFVSDGARWYASYIKNYTY